METCTYGSESNHRKQRFVRTNCVRGLVYNIRSGENGIPNIDTVTSIALGQDLQLTFVLQSFQQLRSLYGEDVESIIRANSANIIFLKSNDEELINDLTRLSGTRHELRTEGRSVARKLGDVLTVGEPVMTYNTNHKETTALTSNDLLFLAGDTPGNAVTFVSNEMPILNKLDTIMPMAAGLHTRLPQPKTGPYADATLPSTNGSDAVNILENVIDGEAMVKALVKQAKIAIEVKKTYLEIAKENKITINERNGDLADLMMNTVFEEYDRVAGTQRQDLASTVTYADIAEEMMSSILAIKGKDLTPNERLSKINILKEHLIRCAMDKNLRDLTQIYRDKPANNPLGYDPVLISMFVNKLRTAYPKEAKLKVEKRDIDYTPIDNETFMFDINHSFHKEALEDIIEAIKDGDLTIDGVLVSENTNKENTYNVSIMGVLIGTFVTEPYIALEVTVPSKKVTEVVSKNVRLNNLIQERILDR